MRYYRNTNRPGFLLGFIDFFTAGIFFLVYMKADGLQDEIESILGHKVMPYWKARTHRGGICLAGMCLVYSSWGRQLPHTGFLEH